MYAVSFIISLYLVFLTGIKIFDVMELKIYLRKQKTSLASPVSRSVQEMFVVYIQIQVIDPTTQIFMEIVEPSNFFWKHPGALGNHLRTRLPGNPRTRLPGFTHAHTTHLYTHAPRYPSGDKPRCAPGNSAPTGLEPGQAARPLPPLASGPLVRSQTFG